MIVLGIIGGYGYNSCIELQKYIADTLTKNKISRNYLKTITINDALINDNNVNISNMYNNDYDTELIEKNLAEKYYDLVKLGCNTIILPCNTNSNLLSNNKFINHNKNIRIINIIEKTCFYIEHRLTNVSEIGIIATSQTIKNKLYSNHLPNIKLISYPDLQNDVNTIILLTQFGYHNKKPNPEVCYHLGIKKSIDPISTMESIIQRFIDNNISHLILGCTELPLFVNTNTIKNLDKITIIDSLELLVEGIFN